MATPADEALALADEVAASGGGTFYLREPWPMPFRYGAAGYRPPEPAVDGTLLVRLPDGWRGTPQPLAAGNPYNLVLP